MFDRKPDDSSVIRLVDSIITTAIDRAASDIHIESLKENIRIRYRIDGILYDFQLIPSKQGPQILSRIKILAHLNTAEKRIPQDGKFHVIHNNKHIDLRVSSFPSTFGEKIVIRILDRSSFMISLDTLGIRADSFKKFDALIHKQQGFLLVTGPTGSGKTTTLYAALSKLNTPEKNIVTLEDPIEYNLDEVTQGQIHPDSGFTFARGIRSMLRQDPDIVMIGEIRDKETARSAIEAALTGHLVLSTVHTNDAPSTIMRLMDMGIEPFLLNTALSGVLSQRLTRKLCTMCRYARTPNKEEKELIGRLQLAMPMVFDARGCDYCFNLGYKGRIGIFELLLMTNDLRACIVHHPVYDSLLQQSKKDGMQTMLEDAQDKVKQGVISLQELARVAL